MMLRECGVKDQVTIYTGPYPRRGKQKTGVGIKSKYSLAPDL